MNLSSAFSFLQTVLLICTTLLAKIWAAGSRSFLLLVVVENNWLALWLFVSALEDVENCSSEAPDFFRRCTRRFDPVHGPCINLFKDDFCLCFRAGRAVPQPSELLLRFLPPLVEGAAARGLPCGEMSSEVSEVNDDLYAAINVLPQGVLEPSSSFVGASEIIAFVWCYLRSHFMQVPMCII